MRQKTWSVIFFYPGDAIDTMRDFRNLKVWEKAHLLALALYKATATFPQAERYGLTSQMRRAAVSIAANIAEGCGRSGVAEFAHFLNVAMGSASELQYHLILARDLNLLNKQNHAMPEQQVTETKRMLTSWIQKLKADS
jgi:four helix bundle protein